MHVGHKAQVPVQDNTEQGCLDKVQWRATKLVKGLKNGSYKDRLDK